jgi:hypothetical protein
MTAESYLFLYGSKYISVRVGGGGETELDDDDDDIIIIITTISQLNTISTTSSIDSKNFHK